MNIPESIIIHHSRTADSKTLSWGAIRRHHIDNNKWSNIGYHYGIELVRDGHEVLVGIMPDAEGAHCSPSGTNRKSIGVCLVGNFDRYEPSPEQLEKCIELVLFLMRQYSIEADKVLGHREVDQRRTCPGRFFNMADFRDEIRRRLCSTEN